MKKMLHEGNQIHNLYLVSGSETSINYGSGSDFLTSYVSGSGFTSQEVTVPTVPVPEHCLAHRCLLQRCSGTSELWFTDTLTLSTDQCFKDHLI
jgi:hypothetical protein